MKGLPSARTRFQVFADRSSWVLPPGEILNASTDSHKSRHKSTPALVKSFVTKQTKNVTIGAGCDHGGLVTFPWRLVTFPGQRCDLWSHGINLRVSGQIRNLFCLPGQERFSYYGFRTMTKCAIVKSRGFIFVDKSKFERQQEKSRIIPLFLR